MRQLYLAAHGPPPLMDRHSNDTTKEEKTALRQCIGRGEQIEIALSSASFRLVHSAPVSALTEADLQDCHGTRRG